MEEKKQFRFQCVRCGTCCSNKNLLVNLSYNDILTIKNGLKLSIDELLEIIGFYIFKEKPTDEDLKKMVIPPIATEHGLAFPCLKKKSTGTCYFFDEKEKKCKIYSLRPNFCRTFPFSFKLLIDKRDNTKGKIKMYYTEKGKEICPGIKADAPITDPKEWIKVGKFTVEDLNDNNILIDKWNEAVREKKISPSAKNYLLTVLNIEKKEKSKVTR